MAFDHTFDRLRRQQRRQFIGLAAAGTALTVLGGRYIFAGSAEDEAARRELRPDGRPRLPPGQRVIQRLKPMGGVPGPPDRGAVRLAIHGAVRNPVTLSFAELLALPRAEGLRDVHCVTGWSCLQRPWTGVSLRTLADLVSPQETATTVIFEAAHGYTANVSIQEVLAEDTMAAWAFDEEPLAGPHGGPLRALVPDLYFWKSAKWLTGIRFETRDRPGFWEVRGYHNHADPWLEERYG